MPAVDAAARLRHAADADAAMPPWLRAPRLITLAAHFFFSCRRFF